MKLLSAEVKSKVKSKIFYSGKYTIISYNIGKTETHLGLCVPLCDAFTYDVITSSLTSVINNTGVSRRVHFNMVSLFIDSLDFHSAFKVRWNRYVRSTWILCNTWFSNRHSLNKLGDNSYTRYKGIKRLTFQSNSCEIAAWTRVQIGHF